MYIHRGWVMIENGIVYGLSMARVWLGTARAWHPPTRQGWASGSALPASSFALRFLQVPLPAWTIKSKPPCPAAKQDGNYVEYKAQEVEDAWADGLASEC